MNIDPPSFKPGTTCPSSFHDPDRSHGSNVTFGSGRSTDVSDPNVCHPHPIRHSAAVRGIGRKRCWDPDVASPRLRTRARTHCGQPRSRRHCSGRDESGHRVRASREGGFLGKKNPATESRVPPGRSCAARYSLKSCSRYSGGVTVDRHTYYSNWPDGRGPTGLSFRDRSGRGHEMRSGRVGQVGSGTRPADRAADQPISR